MNGEVYRRTFVVVAGARVDQDALIYFVVLYLTYGDFLLEGIFFDCLHQQLE